MKSLYVGNISPESQENDIRVLFAEYGTVEAVRMIKDHDTGALKGFCFVEFASPDEANNALKVDGQDFQDRVLKVKIAEDRRKNTGGRAAAPGGANRRRQGRW